MQPSHVVPRDASSIIRATMADALQAQQEAGEAAKMFIQAQQQLEDNFTLKVQELQQEADLAKSRAIQIFRQEEEESRRLLRQQLQNRHEQDLRKQIEEMHNQQVANRFDWDQWHRSEVLSQVERVRQQERASATRKVEEARRQAEAAASETRAEIQRQLEQSYCFKSSMLDSQRESFEDKQRMLVATQSDVLQQKNCYEERQENKKKKIKKERVKQTKLECTQNAQQQRKVEIPTKRQKRS